MSSNYLKKKSIFDSFELKKCVFFKYLSVRKRSSTTNGNWTKFGIWVFCVLKLNKQKLSKPTPSQDTLHKLLDALVSGTERQAENNSETLTTIFISFRMKKIRLMWKTAFLLQFFTFWQVATFVFRVNGKKIKRSTQRKIFFILIIYKIAIISNILSFIARWLPECFSCIRYCAWCYLVEDASSSI